MICRMSDAPYLSGQLLQNQAPVLRQARRLGQGDHLIDMRALWGAKDQALYTLARALNVTPPRRRRGQDKAEARRAFCELLFDAITADRMANNPLVPVK